MALLSYSDASLSKWVKRFNSDRRGGETGSPVTSLSLSLSLLWYPPLVLPHPLRLRLHLARLCLVVFNARAWEVADVYARCNKNRTRKGKREGRAFTHYRHYP